MAEEPSMLQMLKQARGLQKQMKQIQKKVEKRDVAAAVAGGKIEVVCSGKLVIKRILIDQSLLVSRQTDDRRRDLVEHRLDRLLDTFAAIAGTAVAQLDGLVHTGRCAGGNRGLEDRGRLPPGHGRGPCP